MKRGHQPFLGDIKEKITPKKCSVTHRDGNPPNFLAGFGFLQKSAPNNADLSVDCGFFFADFFFADCAFRIVDCGF